jgi:hypothetical protein
MNLRSDERNARALEVEASCENRTRQSISVDLLLLFKESKRFESDSGVEGGHD